MEYNKLIAEMHTGDDVEGFYILKDAFLKTTAAGKPFLSGVLADRSGVHLGDQLVVFHRSLPRCLSDAIYYSSLSAGLQSYK